MYVAPRKLGKGPAEKKIAYKMRESMQLIQIPEDKQFLALINGNLKEEKRGWKKKNSVLWKKTSRFMTPLVLSWKGRRKDKEDPGKECGTGKGKPYSQDAARRRPEPCPAEF